MVVLLFTNGMSFLWHHDIYICVCVWLNAVGCCVWMTVLWSSGLLDGKCRDSSRAPRLQTRGMPCWKL